MSELLFFLINGYYSCQNSSAKSHTLKYQVRKFYPLSLKAPESEKVPESASHKMVEQQTEIPKQPAALPEGTGTFFNLHCIHYLKVLIDLGLDSINLDS